MRVVRTGRTSLVRLALVLAVAACGAESASRGKPDQTAGAGGGAGTPLATGGNAGSNASGSSNAGVAGSAAGRGGNAGSGVAGGGAAGGNAAGSAGAGEDGGRASGGSAGVRPEGGAGASMAGSGGAMGGGSSLGPPGPDGFAVEVKLASELKETAPTTVAIVKWALDEPSLSEAHIDFGLDTTYGMSAPVELTHADYRTVLVGMKPAKTYHFRIVASDGTTTHTSDDRTLTTGAPTTSVSFERFEATGPEQLDQGFIIGSFWAATGTEQGDPWTTFIVDTDGDIVWWYSHPLENATGEHGYARARLSADSQDMWLARVSNGAGPLVRVSMDTLEEQTYPDTRASHDIAAVSGDVMAFLDYGEADCDSIFEIDKAGNTKEVFEGTGVTDEGTGTCHANSVRYSQKEDVYVFSDNLHDVAVVGRDGSVHWKLSEKVDGGNDAWGGQQHGTHLLDESLLIFANQGASPGNATVLEFDLDGGLIRTFPSVGSANFLGDVQRLPSGNTLITYVNKIQVVDPSDLVVLDIVGPLLLFGYVEYRESLYGLPLDIQQ